MSLCSEVMGTLKYCSCMLTPLHSCMSGGWLVHYIYGHEWVQGCKWVQEYEQSQGHEQLQGCEWACMLTSLHSCGWWEGWRVVGVLYMVVSSHSCPCAHLHSCTRLHPCTHLHPYICSHPCAYSCPCAHLHLHSLHLQFDN